MVVKIVGKEISVKNNNPKKINLSVNKTNLPCSQDSNNCTLKVIQIYVILKRKM